MKAREKRRKAEQKEQGQDNPLLCWRRKVLVIKLERKEAGIRVARGWTNPVVEGMKFIKLERKEAGIRVARDWTNPVVEGVKS